MSETFIFFGAWYFVFLFSLTFHEAAHAWAAHKLGDDTAYEGGQVSLDPIPHIRQEPFGTIVVPILTYILGGWMMGWASCPYDPFWALNHPKKSAYMSLAGPVANLIIVIICGIIIHIGIFLGFFYAPDIIEFTQVVAAKTSGFASSAAMMLSIFFSLNLLLFIFNLIPVPPLDGSGILPLFMKDDHARVYMRLINHPTLSLLGIFLAWEAFDVIYDPIHLFAINVLYPFAGYG
ncbi:MAG: hypothetical protein KC618_06805 [Candidatus Omnitrophica bacterium]|nr:hypothetical protein [Candidatus Omnitrophota bacterium]